MGTDTAGSIRIPAALNGVVGYRSSCQRYSREGVFPLAHSLDSLGPLTRSVRDALALDDVLHGRSQRHVATSLKGLRLAAYYGCLMSRPAEIMNFGDPENPTLMESMLAACGAEMVDFPLKTACCGASFGIPERPMTARNSGRILDLATQLGVDAVIVACPLCQMNLDLRQPQASKEMGTSFNLPVLYFTQMMGIAFGLDHKDLGLGKLRVSADGLIRKLDELRRESAAGSKAAEGGRS